MTILSKKTSGVFLSCLCSLFFITCNANQQVYNQLINPYSSNISYRIKNDSFIQTRDNSDPSSARIISILGPYKSEIAVIELSEKIKINSEGRLIYSKIGSSGKRKYINQQGQVIAKINHYDNGFKLKSESGQLLWKIKIENIKWKIADNDEMNNAYKIKKKGKIKIFRNNQEIASAVLLGRHIKVKGTLLNEFNVSYANDLFVAVIGLEEIPLEERLIILAELHML